jgi:hypothetical protein
MRAAIWQVSRLGGGEAAPSPVVLEFVEHVFCIGTVTIELRDDGDVV